MRRSREELVARMVRPAPPVPSILGGTNHKPRKSAPEPVPAPTTMCCADCGGTNLYEFEFRTDYASPRTFSPVNEGTPDMEEPYRLSGTYCDTCSGAVSTKELS